MPIFSAPLEALAAVIFILAGVPMYYLTQHRRAGAGAAGAGAGAAGSPVRASGGAGFFARMFGRKRTDASSADPNAGLAMRMVENVHGASANGHAAPASKAHVLYDAGDEEHVQGAPRG